MSARKSGPNWGRIRAIVLGALVFAFIAFLVGAPDSIYGHASQVHAWAASVFSHNGGRP